MSCKTLTELKSVRCSFRSHLVHLTDRHQALKMGKPTAMHNRSSENMKANIATTTRLFNRAWNKGSKASMFLKPLGPSNAEGKIVKRQNHQASSHAFKTLSSLSGHHLTNVVGGDMNSLRVDGTLEETGAPMLVTFSKGMVLLLEQVLVAYCQQVMSRANELREAVGKHGKVSAKAVRLAATAVDETVYGSTGLSARVTYTPAVKKTKPRGSSKKAKEAAEAKKAASAENAAKGAGK